MKQKHSAILHVQAVAEDVQQRIQQLSQAPVAIGWKVFSGKNDLSTSSAMELLQLSIWGFAVLPNIWNYSNLDDVDQIVFHKVQNRLCIDMSLSLNVFLYIMHSFMLC